jgi:hypothetical protein
MRNLGRDVIDLIYDEDCPNIELARSQLRLALTRCGQPLDWNEYANSNPDLPAYARGYGSPTILIDGVDVGGEDPQHASCCRIYSEGTDSMGAPSTAQIVKALSGSPEQAPE